MVTGKKVGTVEINAMIVDEETGEEDNAKYELEIVNEYDYEYELVLTKKLAFRG